MLPMHPTDAAADNLDLAFLHQSIVKRCIGAYIFVLQRFFCECGLLLFVFAVFQTIPRSPTAMSSTAFFSAAMGRNDILLEENATCCICMSEIKEDKVSLSCDRRHEYHGHCLSKMMGSGHWKCAMCRHTIEYDDITEFRPLKHAFTAMEDSVYRILDLESRTTVMDLVKRVVFQACKDGSITRSTVLEQVDAVFIDDTIVIDLMTSSSSRGVSVPHDSLSDTESSGLSDSVAISESNDNNRDPTYNPAEPDPEYGWYQRSAASGRGRGRGRGRRMIHPQPQQHRQQRRRVERVSNIPLQAVSGHVLPPIQAPAVEMSADRVNVMYDGSVSVRPLEPASDSPRFLPRELALSYVLRYSQQVAERREASRDISGGMGTITGERWGS